MAQSAGAAKVLINACKGMTKKLRSGTAVAHPASRIPKPKFYSFIPISEYTDRRDYREGRSNSLGRFSRERNYSWRLQSSRKAGAAHAQDLGGELRSQQ